jgi:hypothetical protein
MGGKQDWGRSDVLFYYGMKTIPVLIFGLIVLSNARNSLMTVGNEQLNNIADLKKDKIETFLRETPLKVRGVRGVMKLDYNL